MLVMGEFYACSCGRYLVTVVKPFDACGPLPPESLR